MMQWTCSCRRESGIRRLFASGRIWLAMWRMGLAY